MLPASTRCVLRIKVLALVDQSIGTNRNSHSYVTAARPIADNLVIYDPDLICVHAKMQYMYLFVWSVNMAHIQLIDGLELACDYVDLGSAYDMIHVGQISLLTNSSIRAHVV